MDTAIQIIQENGLDRVIIVGPINEEAEVHLANIKPHLGNKIVINFNQVTFINSLGVRSWINFVRDLDGRDVTFEECTPEVVNQINMIPNFKGSAKIASVYGPFHCEDCNQSQTELFVAGKNLPTSDDIELAGVKCKNCGAENIEFEEVEDAYFAFAIGD